MQFSPSKEGCHAKKSPGKVERQIFAFLPLLVF